MKEQIYRALRTIAVVAAAVALVMLLWLLIAPGHTRVRRQPSPETVSISVERIEKEAPEEKTYSTDVAVIALPGNEEGTGEAGVMYIRDRRSRGTFESSGFERSDDRLWYRVTDNTCYYSGWKQIDGKRYYFDADGYAAVGWRAISYQYGCYFDQDGVYIQDKNKARMICLTFEGGPSEFTAEILDILSSNGVKATFFVSGSNAEYYGEILSRAAALGNSIGSNGYSNTILRNATEDELFREFAKTDQLISKYTNQKQTLLARFPGGSYTKEQVAAIEKANIMWDTDSKDLQSENVEFIASEIYSHLQSGSIIRMHDLTRTSVEAVRKIIPEMLSAGYEFVSIEDMAASRGYVLEPGVTYLGFLQSNLDTRTVNDL
ncbi:MAG: polysaccharide deacetylase family protein [Lachnospiraceae bacterium]|nr:polysaccharide deacetylase family protein [Lachnospiraceae bacterium]